ncbi:MAG TPA: DUF488 family protein [Candidatus Hydrogenedentes bacterium]|nr:DUF488 family protein [Candidatus Hydrogenedentota bacterium]HPV37496.1 DUF488 family protein [Candidatus Hydrogenedentota bacterium]HQE76325.1 DUF488 family protein [Candidatus Hydrogenedentota bacterium]
MRIQLRRVYESPGMNDGYRVLVDRVWPRGVSKEAARVDAWNKDVAPSTRLRQWFGHDPGKWGEFKKRYWQELHANCAGVAPLLERARAGRVTLVFGAKDAEHSNAAALREYLMKELGEDAAADAE